MPLPCSNALSVSHQCGLSPARATQKRSINYLSRVVGPLRGLRVFSNVTGLHDNGKIQLQAPYITN